MRGCDGDASAGGSWGESVKAFCCGSEVEKRRVLFGKAGYLEIELCECEATKLAVKYSNTKAQDAAPPVEPR